jgi:hypothetical protein
MRAAKSKRVTTPCHGVRGRRWGGVAVGEGLRKGAPPHRTLWRFMYLPHFHHIRAGADQNDDEPNVSKHAEDNGD